MSAFKLLALIAAMTLAASQAWAIRCYPFYVSVSGLPDTRFEAMTQDSQKAVPGENQPWFIPGRIPKIRLTPENFEAVLSSVLCCGLSRDEMGKILRGLAGPEGTGDILVASLYDRAFQLALKKARVIDPMCFDCMSTALTYLDGKYFARVDDADVPNFGREFFGKFYNKKEGANLKWGDLITVERNGNRAHVMIYLSHGLVLHKVGAGGDVSIEPILQGRDFYQSYFDERRPAETNRLTLTPWHRQPGEKP